MCGENLLKLKKVATKSMTKVINNKHTIIDTLVITTMSLVSHGNESGTDLTLDKAVREHIYHAEKYIDSIDDIELEEVLELCKSIYNAFDIEEISISIPKAYGNRAGWF